MKLSVDAQFFYDHAGYSYDPQKETSEEGRTRCALNLAAAEALGRAAGMSFAWSIDPGTTSGDWHPEGEYYSQWQVICYDSAGNVCQSLGGVDFGDGGEPWGNSYRRVAEAELASEQIGQVLESAA